MSANIRDYFAKAAAQALLTGHATVSEEDAARIAEQAYRVADAMVAKRGGTRPLPKPPTYCVNCKGGVNTFVDSAGATIPCPTCKRWPKPVSCTPTVAVDFTEEVFIAAGSGRPRGVE